MLFLKDISSLLGKEIGCGSERRCYIKVSDPSRCLKISKKQDSDQTLREIKYFEFLQNIGVVASFFLNFMELLRLTIILAMNKSVSCLKRMEEYMMRCSLLIGIY